MARFSVGGDEDGNEERPNNNRSLAKRPRISNPIVYTLKRPTIAASSTSNFRERATTSTAAAPQPSLERILRPEEPVIAEEESEGQSGEESETSESDTSSESEEESGEEEEEEQQQNQRSGNEVRPTEARVDSTPNGNGTSRESEGPSGPVSVTLTDPDVLDCPICFEPLCSPVYQVLQFPVYFHYFSLVYKRNCQAGIQILNVRASSPI